MNPILLDLGFFQLRYYGLMYIIALFLGLYLAKKDLKKASIHYSATEFENIVLFSFLFGILGGRLYYVFFNWQYYFSSGLPWFTPFAVWQGGLAIHGGILGALFGCWLAARSKNMPFLFICDLAAPYLLLGQAFGRFGNFMNGDAHGTPTDLAWGMVFRYGPASQDFPNQALHPVMLYELFLNIIGFLVLFFLRKKRFRAGFITGCYLILYGVIRSVVTNFRADDLYLGVIRAPHLFAVISILFVCIWFYQKKLYLRDNPVFIA